MPPAKSRRRAPRVESPNSHAPVYPSLDQWAHARVVQVPLDDFTVDYELPDLQAFMAFGRIPNPLLPIAEQLYYGVIFEGKLDLEERQAYLQLKCLIIGTHLRKPNLLAELGSDEAAAEWVLQNMPPEHRSILWERGVFHLTGEEALQSLRDLVPFRDGEGLPEVPAGGGGDRESAQ